MVSVLLCCSSILSLPTPYQLVTVCSLLALLLFSLRIVDRDAADRLLQIFERFSARLSRVESTVAALSSSFNCSPAAMSNRDPQERSTASHLRFRPRAPPCGKAKDYVTEWANQLRSNPQNSSFDVTYISSEQQFQVYRYDDANGKATVYELIVDHRAIKSAYLVFGLCGYDMNCFLGHIEQHPIVLVDGELSPEGSVVSCYTG